MSLSVVTTSRFDRELKKLAAKHLGIPDVFTKALGVLSADPFNSSRRYQIKKLEGIAAGDGQYRIRFGRFRYDVSGSTVVLKACSLRREDSYG